jgi:hypothetical protein
MGVPPRDPENDLGTVVAHEIWVPPRLPDHASEFLRHESGCCGRPWRSVSSRSVEGVP